MTSAVCFKCGNEKYRAFNTCGQCGAIPRTESDLSLSLALCEHLSSKSQLEKYSVEIRNKLCLTVSESLLGQAKEALKDPQLMAMLGMNVQAAPVNKPDSLSAQPASIPRHLQPVSKDESTTKELMTTSEIHDFGIEVVKDYLKKEGHEVVSVNTEIALNPQVVAKKNGQLEYIIVRTACYPSKGQIENDKMAFQCIAYANEHKAICYFASVGIANADGKSDAEMAVPVKGSGYHVSFDGLQILTRTDSHPPHLKETVLHRNAFWLLGATTRDDRQRIVELAEEKSLALDHDVCQKARSDLTTPRARLSVEMAWLPGVSPRMAMQLAGEILQAPMSVRTGTGLPSLAHANLMAAAFEAVDAKDNVEDMAEFIQEIAHLVDEISVDEVIRDINEDRAISGFPEVKSDQVEAELAERKRYYRNAIKDAMNRLPTSSLVDAMTLAIDSATGNGEIHAPELIDELVDSYEVEAQSFLLKETENVHKLIEATRDSAKLDEGTVKLLIDKLEIVSRNWHKVAQPILLSAKARGIDHGPSKELANLIRSLAIYLFNEHDLLAQSKRITSLLQELFAELPEVVERVEQDADALQNIFQNRKEAEEWVREITYHAEIGMIFKDTLSISPDGVVWKDKRYPLDAITRVRWGGVNHSVNGIPTGTTYTVAFGDAQSEAVVQLNSDEVYSTFIDKLWKAVGVRLITEMLEALKTGLEIKFGEARLRDDEVMIPKHKLFGANGLVRFGWNQVQVWSADGSFYIGAKDDKKCYAGLTYINAPNVHVLEQVIRMAFKKTGVSKLSDLLQH